MGENTLFQITQHDALTVLYPDASINDRAMVNEFADQLISFVDETKPAKLQINFQYARFFGSEAVTALIRAQRRLESNGGKMNLCGMSKELRSIFRICRLDGPVFHIYDSCRDAAAALEE